MTTTVSVASATRNAQADALARHLDSGSIKIYSGSVPATADTHTYCDTCRLDFRPVHTHIIVFEIDRAHNVQKAMQQD